MAASTFAYQWRRCDSGGGNCADISGATATTYTGTTADVGRTLRVVVTAGNRAGTTSATSAPSAIVAGEGPVNTVLPKITLAFGTTVPVAGTFVSASTGTWTGASGITFTYQWSRCQPSNGPCTEIAGATGSSFLVTGSLKGQALRVTVTAKNKGGENSANSLPTELVVDNPPVLLNPPRLIGADGMVQVGQQIGVDTGTWQSTLLINYTYQWRRCDPQGTISSCVAIAGAALSTYTPTEADQGLTLRAYVTATTSGGAVTSISGKTFPIIAAPHVAPAVSSVPTVTGKAAIGERLQASPGSWTGFVPITYVYRWQRCDAAARVCTNVPNATKTSYLVTARDIGFRLRLAVVARNSIGATRAVSLATEPIFLDLPSRAGALGSAPSARTTSRGAAVTTGSSAAAATTRSSAARGQTGSTVVRATTISTAARARTLSRAGPGATPSLRPTANRTRSPAAPATTA